MKSPERERDYLRPLPLDFGGKLPAALFCLLQPVAGQGKEISD